MWILTSGLAMVFWFFVCIFCVGMFVYSFFKCAKNQFAKEMGSKSPTILARVDELEQAEIVIGDEILRNKTSVSVPRIEDVLGYFDMIFTKKSDDFIQGILRDVICYVRLFDEKVLICFNLLDEHGENVEVCEVLDSSDLGDRVCSDCIKSEQIQIGMINGVFWILAKI